MGKIGVVALSVLAVLTLVWAFAPDRRTSAELPAHAVCNPADKPEKLALVVEIDPSTAWQPRSGDIKFTVKGTKDAGLSTTDINIAACFYWYSADGKAAWYRSPSVRLVSSTNDQSTPSAIYAATVPADLPDAEGWSDRMAGQVKGTFTGLFATVPVAKFRILAAGPASAKWSPAGVIFDTGITSIRLSFIMAIIAVAAAWGLLYFFGTKCDVPGKGAILRIISTRKGYASLSQFQIVLWSFVIGGGAVYVMALSGNLINITQGTLILLGITGAATVGSKLKSHQETQPASAAAAPTPPGPPRELTFNGSSGIGYVRLLWAAPTSGKPTSYTVQFKKHADQDWLTASSTVTHTRFAVVGLEGDEYDFRVLAVNEGGASDPSNVVSDEIEAETVVRDAPGPVENFIAATPDPKITQVELSWKKIDAASDYVVEYRLHDSDRSWQSIGDAVPNAGFAGRSIVPGRNGPKLLPNKRYDFRVAARDQNGSRRGAWSSIASATPAGRVPRWADLVIVDDEKQEIDVTRVQMLFFTVISAAFVAMKVLVSSVIPEIPEGFLLLMGISNGVYLTAKFVPD